MQPQQPRPVEDRQEEAQQYDSFLYKFQQQIIDAWKPVPHTSSNVILYFILSVICIGLGLGLVLSAPNSQQVYVRYDQICSVDSTLSGTIPVAIPATCSFTFTLDSTLAAPIYMYYGLKGFYQNHRRYIKFFSSAQLTGGSLSQSDAQSYCGDFITNSQCQYTTSNTSAALTGSATAFPCGTIGRMYNKFKKEIKSFTIYDGSSNQITLTKTGIAWPSDIGRFKNYDLSQQPFDVTDEQFLIWFRPGARSDFYKLNGIINSDLPAGTYTVAFLNHVDASFGQKWFSLSKSNYVGNRDLFLGIAFLVLGGGCLILLIIFIAKWINEKRGKPKIE